MKVLVIAPHMDDEVLGPGGAIARHVERRDRVSVVIAANRAYGHRYRASAIRQEEACAKRAQKVLGYHRLEFLRLPDEKLDQGLARILLPLEKAFQSFQPDLVYLPHRGDLNQDHRAVFEAGVIVCRPLARNRPRKVLCYEVPSSTDQSPAVCGDPFLPNEYLPLSDRQLEKKTEALLCYEREMRKFPHPRSVEGLRILAAKRGMEAGLEAAEAFLLVRKIHS